MNPIALRYAFAFAMVAAVAAIARFETTMQRADSVVVVKDRSSLAGCAFLREVNVQPRFCGFVSLGIGFSDTLGRLRSAAQDAGANHLYVPDMPAPAAKGVPATMSGEAYRCPA